MLLVVAALASYLPARRAAKINPIEALRVEGSANVLRATRTVVERLGGNTLSREDERDEGPTGSLESEASHLPEYI